MNDPVCPQILQQAFLHRDHFVGPFSVNTAYRLAFSVRSEYRSHFIPVMIRVLHPDDVIRINIITNAVIHQILLVLQLRVIGDIDHGAAAAFFGDRASGFFLFGCGRRLPIFSWRFSIEGRFRFFLCIRMLVFPLERLCTGFFSVSVLFLIFCHAVHPVIPAVLDSLVVIIFKKFFRFSFRGVYAVSLKNVLSAVTILLPVMSVCCRNIRTGSLLCFMTQMTDLFSVSVPDPVSSCPQSFPDVFLRFLIFLKSIYIDIFADSEDQAYGRFQ